MNRFDRYQLRTTDVAAARSFYSTLLGDGSDDIAELPSSVVARGARPHWLGHIGVDDVERAAAAFVEYGAERLGPTRSDGAEHAVALVRDPGGAVVALATPTISPPRTDVVWHGLNTNDLDRAIEAYCALFHWHITDRLDLGPLGVNQRFAFGANEPAVGAMTDIADRPGVHPHWLFQFRVAALEPAIALVRSAGGFALEPLTLPDGDRLAVCDDPQGAAFALRESRSSMPP